MIFHNLPEKTLGATVWLPLGPIAMGAYGLMTLGEAGRRIVENSSAFPWLNSLNSLGIIGAVILLGFASWILLMALLITVHYIRRGLPYNMTFWSFTFPLGVYTLAVLTLSRIIGIAFFAYYGALLTLVLTLIWLYVAWKTLPGLLRGDLIRNPLL
jgi:tellurite resistance protein TehA-like permease